MLKSDSSTEYRFRYIFFPIFPPPFLARTSLFLHKLEEDNICLLMQAHLSDESLGVCLTNPKNEWFGPIAGLSMFV
jgi:hypothetical protein